MCAGSDVMHPLGALVVGGVPLFCCLHGDVHPLPQNRWKIDDVLGVPAAWLCGVWGGVPAPVWPNLAGRRRRRQSGLITLGTLAGVLIAFIGGGVVYGVRPGSRRRIPKRRRPHRAQDPAPQTRTRSQLVIHTIQPPSRTGRHANTRPIARISLALFTPLSGLKLSASPPPKAQHG